MSSAGTPVCTDSAATCLNGHVTTGPWHGGAPGCVVNWLWVWGDGTSTDYITYYPASSNPNWYHYYTDPGVYSASATGTVLQGNCYTIDGTFLWEVPGIPQAITFTSTIPTNASAGGTYLVSATGGGSGNPVTFSVPGHGHGGTPACTISGTTVTFTVVGTCIIDANQAGNATYDAAPTVDQQVPVGPALTPQAITFMSTTPSGAVVGNTYVVSATGGGSGNPVTFSIDSTTTSLCSISGPTVTFLAVGTCVIDANQAGSASFLPAPQAQQQVKVAQAPQTITFTSTAKDPVVGSIYTVSATGGASGNPVTFTIDTSTSSICTIAGTTVTFDAVGTCLIDAHQLGDANYLAAPQAQQPVVVTAVPQAQNQSYGTAENTSLSEASGTLQDGVVDLNPTATSWTATEVTGPAHGTLTLSADGAFTYTPTTGFLGSDSFTYTLTDNLGFVSAPATVTINVSTSCNIKLWPKKIQGFPIVNPGSPAAFYIGEKGGHFSLYAAHPAKGNKDTTETGTITIGPKNANVAVSNLVVRKGEDTPTDHDTAKLINQWTITFSFDTFKSLDGLTFTASCGSQLTFNLKADTGAGAPQKQAPAKQIHLGRPTTSPAKDPFTETR